MALSISLSDGEWKLMNLLWESAPRTITQLVKALADDTGWSKATVLVMLRRMEQKGAVTFEQSGRSKQYFPSVPKDGIAVAETESFLQKVYGGSLGLLVSSMATQKALSKKEIDELYEILKKAEEESEQ